jgi:hypothetical protein
MNLVSNWSRESREFWAPFATVLVAVTLGLGLWRLVEGDGEAATRFFIFTAVGAIYAATGWRWRRRRNRSEDKWRPLR